MGVTPGGQGLLGVAMLRNTHVVTATIASGTSVSDAIDLAGAVLLAIIVPSAWTTAAMSFRASDTATGTFGDVWGDDGSEVTVASNTLSPGKVIVPAGILENLAPLRFLKVRSGPSSLPVNQASTVEVKFICKG